MLQRDSLRQACHAFNLSTCSLTRSVARAPLGSWLHSLRGGNFVGMGRHGRLLAQLLGGRADANVGFEALCALLRRLGFTERTRGSHHLFQRTGVEELINLQRDGEKAKVYQVRQVRTVLLRYGLTTLEGNDT